jgi:apolipoprotein N-acyltransferase
VRARHAVAAFAFALAGLASGGCFYLGTGLSPLWPLAWLAPLPVLIVAYAAAPRTAAGLAFTAWLLGGLNLWTYLRPLGPLPVRIGFLAIPAAAFALSVLLSRALVRRGALWLGVFSFPAAWVSYEYLLSMVSPHGTGGSLAYSQADCLPLLQVASVTGIWGVLFVLLLLPPALAATWHSRARPESRAPLVAAIAVAAVVLALGWARLKEPSALAPLPVGLAAADGAINRFDTDRADEALPVIDAYGRRVDTLASRGARVVVLPEKFVGVADPYAPVVLRRLGDIAKRSRVTLVAGLNRLGVPGNRNIAVAFSPESEILWTYDKMHMLPGFEDGYLSGNQTAILSGESTRWGVSICKDMDFPAHGRRYADAGIGLMLVPAWDFGRDAWLHARMAVVRGVEGGFAVARTAQQGLLTVSDDRGRVIAETRSDSSPETFLVAYVTPGQGRTLYGRLGDWFAWLCMAIVLMGLRRCRRLPQHDERPGCGPPRDASIGPTRAAVHHRASTMGPAAVRYA